MEFNVTRFSPLRQPRRPGSVPLKRVLEHLRAQDAVRRKAKQRFKPTAIGGGPSSAARRGEFKVVDIRAIRGKRSSAKGNKSNGVVRRTTLPAVPSRVVRYPWKRVSDPVFIQKLNTHSVAIESVKRIEALQRAHPSTLFSQQLEAYLNKRSFTHTHVAAPIIHMIKWIVVYGKYNQEQNYDTAYTKQFTTMFNKVKDRTINKLYFTRRKDLIVRMLNAMALNRSVLTHFIRITYNAFKLSSETKFYNTSADAKLHGGQYLRQSEQIGGAGKAELLAEAAKAGFQFGSNVSADINKDDSENDRALAQVGRVIDSANNFFRYQNS